MAPKRRNQRANPLALLQHYLANPGPFARPAPPAEPPLPLKFVHIDCGHETDPDQARCQWCGMSIRPPNYRK